jgi:hypothetical protein
MPAGISESEFKHQKELIKRRIRSLKIEVLEANEREEKANVKFANLKADAAEEHVRQAEIELQIENVETEIRSKRLQKVRVESDIAGVEVQTTKDRLSFERQRAEINCDIYGQKLRELDLNLGESRFNNDDRVADNRVREVDTGLPRSFSFAGSGNPDLN